MRVKWVSWLVVCASLAACGRAQETDGPAAVQPAPQLVEAWRLQGLANPESVALSADGAELYVTNVDGEGDAKDGAGFISRVSTDGTMIERTWVSGLNAPKGVARDGGVLYVADIDEIAIVDIARGEVTRRIAAPNAQFLNDVAFVDGTALIADSGGGRIYALHDGAIAVWLEDPLLDSVNGLLPESGRIVVTTMAGRLLSIDIATKTIEVLAEGLGDADGVARAGDGWLVSEWPGLMHYVRADGGRETLIDSRASEIYLNDFLLVGDMLYQPNWEPSTLTAYRVQMGP